MRMMTPIGYAARVITGRMKCLPASQNATQLPVISASTTCIPVIWVIGWACATVMLVCPATGSQPSILKNRICSISASQNDAIDTPAVEKRRMKWSSQPPLMCAVVTPRMIPNTVATIRAATTSSSVEGKKWMMSLSTGRLVRSDSPQSPVTRPFM